MACARTNRAWTGAGRSSTPRRGAKLRITLAETTGTTGTSGPRILRQLVPGTRRTAAASQEHVRKMTASVRSRDLSYLSDPSHLASVTSISVIITSSYVMAQENPFVYGEVVPASAFVGRDAERDRLVTDLAAGQNGVVISSRRNG